MERISIKAKVKLSASNEHLKQVLMHTYQPAPICDGVLKGLNKGPKSLLTFLGGGRGAL